MPRIPYTERRFSDDSLDIIAQANVICADYQAQGYDLTLRQLYYQFVSRDLLPNNERSYKRLGSIINDARLAGKLDWHYIVDRTRNLRDLAHWNDPAELVEASASQFRIDRWAEQSKRIEVWIEKDALVGVLQAACPQLDVPYFSCRGYTSQSEVWGAAQRLGKYIESGQQVVIIHLGDHDPSGVDMTRDIEDRLALFIAHDSVRAAAKSIPGGLSQSNAEATAEEAIEQFRVQRIALNMDQIEQYDPPPNPAKFSDSRAASYVAEYGRSSWELDALEPTVLVELIRGTVAEHRDEAAWKIATSRQESERAVLKSASKHWEDVAGLACQICGGPATHYYGDVLICCGCHIGDKDGGIYTEEQAKEWHAKILSERGERR